MFLRQTLISTSVVASLLLSSSPTTLAAQPVGPQNQAMLAEQCSTFKVNIAQQTAASSAAADAEYATIAADFWSRYNSYTYDPNTSSFDLATYENIVSSQWLQMFNNYTASVNGIHTAIELVLALPCDTFTTSDRYLQELANINSTVQYETGGMEYVLDQFINFEETYDLR